MNNLAMTQSFFNNQSFHSLMKELVSNIESLDSNDSQNKVDNLVVLNSDLKKYLEKKGAQHHFNNFVNALKEKNKEKALLHSKRLAKTTKLSKNDCPAKKDQEVSIVRYSHGWIDCNWSGIVTNAYKVGDTWQYIVRINHMDGQDLTVSEQFSVDINHTRDLSF